MESLLIANGRVFDGEKFIQGDVLINGSFVERIGKGLKADRVLDAAGMTVLPGLVDVHLHIKGVSPPAWSVDGEKGCFPFGVTAAADASASQGDREGLKALPVKNGVFVVANTKDPLCFDTVAERLQRYGDRVLGIKVLYDRKMNPALSDESKLIAIRDFAHARKLPLTVHTANSPVSMDTLLSVLDAGDIATHVFHGGGNNAMEDDFNCLKKARSRGVLLDSCICAGEHADFEIYRKAIAAGIYPDLIGTDLADGIASRGYGLTACMSVARVLGMPEEAIFRAVTGNAGDALHRPWGRLKEGGPADIAVLQWAKAPMELSDRSGNRVTSDCRYICRLTLRGGRPVHQM